MMSQDLKEIRGRPSEDAVPSVWLDIGADGELMVIRDGERKRAHLKLCFPWTSPRRYLSLRDDDQNEIRLIQDIGDLDEQSRKALEEALVRARFVFEVTAIISVRTEFELRQWIVKTKQGDRRFQTKLDHWPRPLATGGFLIRDIASDLYFIADPEAMDARSQKILWAFVD